MGDRARGGGGHGLGPSDPPTRPRSDLPPTNAQLVAGLTFDLGGPARLTCIRYARARCGRLLRRRLAGRDIVGRLHHQSHRRQVVAATGDKQRVAKRTRGVELDTSPKDSLSASNWNYPVGSGKWRVWRATDGGGTTSPTLRWVSVLMRDGPWWTSRGRSRGEWGRERGLAAPSDMLGSDGSRNLNCTT